MWNNLDPRKRLVFGLALVAAVMAVFGLVRVATTPSMALLYAGLDASSAGEVITSLEQRGLRFDVRGDAIYVEAAERDQARLSLAGEGLPASGIAGYELLDGLSGFGTTSQMFDATYWRAKEGELARTLVASPMIRSARVHIANGADRPFDRSITPTASVTLGAKNGAIPASFAESARFMVAAAVNGLLPENVTVIDADQGVVMLTGDQTGGAPGAGGTDDRAESMRHNMERLLAARVGAGNAIVEVNIDVETQSETVTQRLLDPQSKVQVSTESESQTDNSNGSPSGAITVASNLPDGDTGSGGGQQSRNRNSTREQVNYDFSETVRETVRGAGEIKRITAAVLVNGISTVDDTGQTVWAPRPEAEMTALRELVQSAIGFDPDRGDVVTLQSMQLSQPPELGTLVDESPGFLSNNAMTLIQLGVLALVSIVLGLFVLRPLLATKPQLPPLAPDTPNLPDGAATALLSPPEDTANAPPALTHEGGPSAADMLRTAISERSVETNRLLKNWIETPDNSEEVPA